MIGTVVGAVMSVVLVACFPQDRILFLGGLALWGAACAFVATLLRNFASYAAALAGYTAAIIAGDLLGASRRGECRRRLPACRHPGQRDLHRHRLRRRRSRRDRSRRRPAPAGDALFADLSAGITGRFRPHVGGGRATSSPTRSRLGANLSVGSSPSTRSSTRRSGNRRELRYHSPVLQAPWRGLFAALCRLARGAPSPAPAAGRRDARQEAATGARKSAAGTAIGSGAGRCGALDRRSRRACADLRAAGAALDRSAGRDAVAAAARRPSGRGARAASRTRSNGLALLVADPAAPGPRRGSEASSRARLAPALVNAGRAFLTIGAVAAVLDRHRMAERRSADHLRHDHRPAARAAGAIRLTAPQSCFTVGIRHRPASHGDHRLCGAAGTGTDALPPCLVHRHFPCADRRSVAQARKPWQTGLFGRDGS